MVHVRLSRALIPDSKVQRNEVVAVLSIVLEHRILDAKASNRVMSSCANREDLIEETSGIWVLLPASHINTDIAFRLSASGWWFKIEIGSSSVEMK